MDNNIKHDPITGEPIENIDDQEVQLDPVTELQLMQQEVQNGHQIYDQPFPQYQQTVGPQPGQMPQGQPGPMPQGQPYQGQPGQVNQQMTQQQAIQLQQMQLEQQMQYQGQPMYTQPQQIAPVEHPDNTNPSAKKLCWASLILWIFSKIGARTFFGTVSESMEEMMGGVTMLAVIAAYVLMIIVRVKYPKNRFGKVLMWIYIVEFVLLLLLVILVIALCSYYCGSCAGMG